VPFPCVAPYVASKFAVAGLSRALDCELAPRGIRVTALCPGAVKTGVLRHGRLNLPGTWGERISKLLDAHGAAPEQAARDVLAAVYKRRTVQISGAATMFPLWILERAWPGAYHHLARWAFGKAARR
jgi:short-subunit dehydrogenase